MEHNPFMDKLHIEFLVDLSSLPQGKYKLRYMQGGAPKIAKLVYNSNNYGL